MRSISRILLALCCVVTILSATKTKTCWERIKEFYDGSKGETKANCCRTVVKNFADRDEAKCAGGKIYPNQVSCESTCYDVKHKSAHQEYEEMMEDYYYDAEVEAAREERAMKRLRRERAAAKRLGARQF